MVLSCSDTANHDGFVFQPAALALSNNAANDNRRWAFPAPFTRVGFHDDPLLLAVAKPPPGRRWILSLSYAARAVTPTA